MLELYAHGLKQVHVCPARFLYSDKILTAKKTFYMELI